MSQELTDKTHCLLLRNGIEVWLNTSQAERLKAVLQTNVKNVEIDGEFIAVQGTDGKPLYYGIFSAGVVKANNRKKQGEWECGFGYWHERDQQCGHGLMR